MRGNYDWEQRKLGEITDKIGSGKTPKGGSSVYTHTGTPLLRSQNVSNDRVNFSDVVYITESMDKEMANSRVQRNDILLNITGASIGRSAVYEYSERANVNQHVCIIRPQSGNNPYFVQLNITSPNGQRQIEFNQAGGGREGLNFQQIAKITFFYPNEDEQIKIGNFFKQLENTIALHQRRVDLLKQMKQGYLQSMFPQNEEKVPKLRFANFGAPWEQCKLKDISKIYDGTHQTPKYTDSGIKFVSVEDINDIVASNKYISIEDYETQFKNKPEVGDIFMTRITAGVIGATAIIENDTPIAYYVSLALIKPSKKNSSLFLSSYISTKVFKKELNKRIIHTAFPKKINLSEIGECNISKPKKDEQAKIGIFFKELDNTIALHQTKLEKLHSLKKAYLQKMFI